MRLSFHHANSGVLGHVWTDEDGKVQMDEGGKTILDGFNVIADGGKTLLTPRDGERFIAGIRATWRGSYIWTELEKDDVFLG